jgi:hypothetical protein
MENEFRKIGVRSLKTTNSQTIIIDEGKNWFCPCCNAGPLDGATGFQVYDESQCEPEPELMVACPGQPVICSYCANFLIFKSGTNGLCIFKASDYDLEGFQNDADFWHELCQVRVKIQNDIVQSRIRGELRHGTKSNPDKTRRFF